MYHICVSLFLNKIKCFLEKQKAAWLVKKLLIFNMADCIRDGINSAAALADRYDEPSEITCICCAELELELEKTRTELRSGQKIFELQWEDNLCYALCANASSSELRRFTGLHQLNDVLNKDNHIQKDKSDKIKELKSDIAELNHLLKYTIRQSVKDVISTEINTILAEIDSLWKITSEQMPMETKWTEIVTRRHKRNNSDRGDNIYSDRGDNIYRIPC
jgi:hypothetical protein